MEALGGIIQVVPNSTLNKETIQNWSRPLPIRMEMIELTFSFDDPPNKVCQALFELAKSTEGVVQSPKPIAATIGYGERGVNYRLIWRVPEEKRWGVRHALITRIWYMARRQGFTMPYPVSEQSPSGGHTFQAVGRVGRRDARARPAHSAGERGGAGGDEGADVRQERGDLR